MKMISVDEKIINVTDEYPEIIDILVDMGFIHLKNPVMRASVGKVITLRKAAKNHDLKLSEIQKILNEHGFDILEEIND